MQVGDAQGVAQVDVALVQREPLLAGGERLVIARQRVVAVGEVGVRLDHRRVELEGAAQVADGLLRLPAAERDDAEVVVGDSQVGVDRRGAQVGDTGLFQLVQLLIADGHAQPDVGHVGVAHGGDLEELQRALEVAAAERPQAGLVEQDGRGGAPVGRQVARGVGQRAQRAGA